MDKQETKITVTRYADDSGRVRYAARLGSHPQDKLNYRIYLTGRYYGWGDEETAQAIEPKTAVVSLSDYITFYKGCYAQH